MAVLPTRSFAAIVATISAGMQGRAGIFVNFLKGSVFLVFAEAYAGIGLFFQFLIVQVQALTRLATSFGNDVDTWLADWGLITRIGSVPATGLVQFSRNTVSGSAPVIKVGATVRTQDGTTTFAVYADSTNPNYAPDITAYVMPAQVATIPVPVVCTTPSANGTVLANGTVSSGANGNVAAGAISTITSQIIGVDTVTNLAAFTNGSDQEMDPAVKARFPMALQALSKGTPAAIALAIQSLQTGLQVQVLDGANADGSVNPGMVTVIVDDGSGSMSNVLLEQAAVAANAVRAAGVRMAVLAAQLHTVQVQLVLSVKQGYTRSVVAAQVSAAVAAGINAGGLGGEVDYLTVGSWALAVAGVAKIDGLTINGTNLDIAGDPRYTLKCSGVVVN